MIQYTHILAHTHTHTLMVICVADGLDERDENAVYWMLGCCYKGTDAMEKLSHDFFTRLWFTYRYFFCVRDGDGDGDGEIAS